MSTRPINCLLVICIASAQDIKFAPDGGTIAIATQDGIIRIVDFASDTEVCTFTSYFGGVLCLEWSDDGDFLLVRTMAVSETEQ
jgi:WD40 repeat protein